MMPARKTEEATSNEKEWKDFRRIRKPNKTPILSAESKLQTQLDIKLPTLKWYLEHQFIILQLNYQQERIGSFIEANI